jgi:hypothetical protein
MLLSGILGPQDRLITVLLNKYQDNLPLFRNTDSPRFIFNYASLIFTIENIKGTNCMRS